jgi:hypothetical protein
MSAGHHEPSPLLGRKYDIRDYVPYHNAREERQQRDRYMARITLERLLHKKWLRQGRLSNFMQRLGDWGRANGFVGLRW